MIGPISDMFTEAMFIFSSVKSLNMYKSRTGWPTSIGILWKWASKPTELAGDSECRLSRFHQIRNFLANEIYHFSRPSHQTGLSFNQSSLLHIISSLFSHFCLFQTAILHKMLKLGFWNFKPIFLRMQFSLVATFFSLVLVISLSWYFHLTISYLTLWKSNGLSKHLKGHQVIGLDLSTSPKLAVKWIIIKWYYVVDLIFDSIWIILVFYCKFCAFKNLFCIAYF